MRWSQSWYQRLWGWSLSIRKRREMMGFFDKEGYYIQVMETLEDPWFDAFGSESGQPPFILQLIRVVCGDETAALMKLMGDRIGITMPSMRDPACYLFPIYSVLFAMKAVHHMVSLELFMSFLSAVLQRRGY